MREPDPSLKLRHPEIIQICVFIFYCTYLEWTYAHCQAVGGATQMGGGVSNEPACDRGNRAGLAG